MTSNRFVLRAAALLTAAVPTFAAAQTSYPLEIQNCGRSVVFEKAPESMVSLGQSTTEIMFHLGLADKLAGTAVWFTDPLPQYAEINAQIPILAENDPSFESVIATKPDLVAAQFLWHLGPEGIVTTPKQLADLGVNSYISPADCGKDGVKQTSFTMQMIYDEIIELATIFNVAERGENLVTELKTREANAKARIADLGVKDLSAVFWFSSAEMDLDPYVAGRGYAAEYAMKALGISNVIDSEKEWPNVGWETISAANPDIVVIGKMTRRRYPADDWKLKKEFLTSDPVTSLMPAVKNGHILPIDAHAMDASIRTIYGIEELADAVVSYGLTK